jgi:hypothetical protein
MRTGGWRCLGGDEFDRDGQPARKRRGRRGDDGARRACFGSGADGAFERGDPADQGEVALAGGFDEDFVGQGTTWVSVSPPAKLVTTWDASEVCR